MPIYTRKEFCERLNLSQAHISVAISRKNLIVKNGMIDDSDSVNREYIERNTRRKNGQSRNIESQSLKQSNSNESILNSFKGNSLHDIKTKAQIAELKEKIDILKAKKTKMAEEIIPRDHAEYLIKNFSTGIVNVWLTATERFLMQKGTALSLSREEIIEHKKYITEILNDAVRQGANEANTNIKNLAKEFAGKKGRGESE